MCEGTDTPIGFKRLELRPWTRYSVAYKEQLERERSQHRRPRQHYLASHSVSQPTRCCFESGYARVGLLLPPRALNYGAEDLTMRDLIRLVSTAGTGYTYYTVQE